MTTTDCTTYDPNTYGARDYAVDTTRNTTATTLATFGTGIITIKQA